MYHLPHIRLPAPQTAAFLEKGDPEELTFENILTGKTLGRPGFNLFTHEVVRPGGVNVGARPGGFGRTTFHIVHPIEELHKRGIKTRSLKEE